ncbi:hypothetical protein BD413DRAFT_674957, partial [Trametes elegans]
MCRGQRVVEGPDARGQGGLVPKEVGSGPRAAEACRGRAGTQEGRVISSDISSVVVVVSFVCAGCLRVFARFMCLTILVCLLDVSVRDVLYCVHCRMYSFPLFSRVPLQSNGRAAVVRSRWHV